MADVGCSSAPCGHFVTNPAGTVSGDPLFATGGRTPSDLLITAQYNSGGSLATAIVYQWKLVSGTYQWVDITSSIAVNTAFVATNTVDGVSVPYGAFGATTYSKNQFVEMSIDATQLIKVNVDPCSGIEVHSVFVRTKTSTSASAVLDDFVTPISVSFSAGFTVSLTQSAVSCFGGSNGSVTATINGGTPPYSVTLGATTQTVLTDGGSTTFTGLSAGTKTVHVVATGGCTKDVMIDVTQPASAVGSSITSQTNVGCFGGSTASVTVAGSGGTPSYTYSIDGTNFGVSGTFNNLAAGPYTVTVKDANGCATTQAVTITQTGSAVSSSISSKTNVACFGGSTGSVTVVGSGGTGPYTYSINGTIFGASGTFSNLAAGSYTVTVKDANGCTTTQPVTITQPAAAVSASISSQTNVACFGGSTGSVTVAGSGGTSPYTYAIDGTTFGASGTFSSLGAGSYTITVKDANGCTTTQPVTITQPASAVGSSISSQTNVGCFGSSTGSVTVAGSGGTSPYTYAIDGTTFGASGTFSSLAAGSYTVTVKDADGCTTTQAVTITQPAVALSSSISSQTNVACFGGSTGSVTVAGSGGTSPYTFSKDGTIFGNSGTFGSLVAGSYTITVKDANGCTTTQPVTITQPASALGSSISSQTNVACFDGSTGSVTVAGSGGTSPYTYAIDGTTFGASGIFSSLAAGSYTVTVKDAHGCTTTQAVTITQPASAVSGSISSQTNVACFGGSTGSVTVAGSGGTSPYTFSKDGVDFRASGTFGSLAAGFYTITVKDAKGCTTTQPVTITQPASALGSSISSQTNVACFGGSTGSVTVAGSGGTSPYTYAIDGTTFGASGTFSSLGAGSYTITVKDANGCATTQGVTVTQPAAALSSSISSQTNVACFGGSTGSVTVAASGGTSPYTFSKDGVNFGVSGTFSNLAAGSYTITVKDANGCTTTQGVTITQPAAALSSSISSQTNVACFGNSTGSVTVAGSGGTSPYTYAIDGVTFGNSGMFSNLAAGSYTVTVKDANGCTTTQPVTITEPAAALSSSISSQTNVACFGNSTGSVTVSGSGGTGPYTYAIDGVTFGNSGTFNNLAAGSYTITAKDANGCTTTQPVTITEPAAALSSSISSQTNVACFGGSTGSVTVAGSGGTSPYTFSKDGVNFGASGTFSNLAAGSYTVTVKDANGCSTTQPVTITEPASALGSSISSQTNVGCFGGSTGSVTVAGSGGTAPFTYSIDGTNFGNSGTFSNLAAGSYTVTVKDANGCTTTQPVTITQPAATLSSSISSQTNVACFGSSTGSVTVAGSGGTVPFTYSIDGTNFGNSGTFSNLAAGSYTITVKDANGCTTTQSVTITQPASGLTASALATNPACSTGTGSITVTASGGTGALSYSIDGTNFQASNVFSGLASGSYTITVKDANGCTTTTGATVTIPTAVTASSSKADPLCNGQLGSMTVTFSGGTPGYECSLDNGSFAPCTSPATFDNLGAGSHTVAVRNSNACLGPSQTKTIVIPTAINASITTTPASSSIAADGTMTVTANGGTPGYSVTLNGGPPHTIAASGGSTTFTGLTSGGYNVVITDANGCSLGIAEQLGVAPATTGVRLCNILSSIGTGGKTTFMVTLPKGPLTQPLTVSYVTSATAIFGVDYSLSGIFGKITIPAGKTSATVTITALKNLARKTNRTATMTIVNGPGYFTTTGFNTATVTIRR